MVDTKFEEKFLEKNGFKQVKKQHFQKDSCTVIIHDMCYEVNDGKSAYGPNLEIYWLIGYLTYYGYMDKNYKK